VGEYSVCGRAECRVRDTAECRVRDVGEGRGRNLAERCFRKPSKAAAATLRNAARPEASIRWRRP
ncbi:MAG TPA: hypothetical protein VME43_24220, partial [Bryobacteraceae bacterium]|nr:hypothetical protein [Bryobacteraceae bacterium]